MTDALSNTIAGAESVANLDSLAEVDDRVAPKGNIRNFLNVEQCKYVRNLIQVKCNQRESNVTKTLVNAVMDPLKSYFNPLENILSDSDVDNGLENLFSLESIGIKTDDKELL